jgi:hypothetical protein
MAAVVYEHNKFHNWSTYNGGQYQSYMAEVKAAWPNRSKPGTVATTSNTNPGGSALPGNAGKAVDAAAGVVTGTVNATESTAQAIGKVGEGIGKAAVWTGNPHNWLRVAYVALGTAVVIAGLVKLTGLRGVTPLAVAANAAKPKAQPVTKKAEREEASSDD